MEFTTPSIKLCVVLSQYCFQSDCKVLGFSLKPADEGKFEGGADQPPKASPPAPHQAAKPSACYSRKHVCQTMPSIPENGKLVTTYSVFLIFLFSLLVLSKTMARMNFQFSLLISNLMMLIIVNEILQH